MQNVSRHMQMQFPLLLGSANFCQVVYSKDMYMWSAAGCSQADGTQICTKTYIELLPFSSESSRGHPVLSACLWNRRERLPVSCNCWTGTVLSILLVSGLSTGGCEKQMITEESFTCSVRRQFPANAHHVSISTVFWCCTLGYCFLQWPVLDQSQPLLECSLPPLTGVMLPADDF